MPRLIWLRSTPLPGWVQRADRSSCFPSIEVQKIRDACCQELRFAPTAGREKLRQALFVLTMQLVAQHYLAVTVRKGVGCRCAHGDQVGGASIANTVRTVLILSTSPLLASSSTLLYLPSFAAEGKSVSDVLKGMKNHKFIEHKWAQLRARWDAVTNHGRVGPISSLDQLDPAGLTLLKELSH